jgi:uncharacterized membrane protein YjgN (DUF898 family)
MQTDLSPAPAPSTERFEFTGSGSEYFRIWIVNWLLILLTLGLYSPWAKVRREKFFHQHLHLAGSSFDYHASPWAILRGRVIALALLALTQVEWIGGLVALAALIAFYLILPWVLRNSMRFRLANTSYRGIRFYFDATTRQVYKLFLVLTGPIILGLVLGTLAVLWLADDSGGAVLPDAQADPQSQDDPDAENDPTAQEPSALPAWALVLQRFGGAAGTAIVLLAFVGPTLLMPYTHGLWRKFITDHSLFGNMGFGAGFTAQQTAKVYYLSALSFLGIGLGVMLLAGGFFAFTSFSGDAPVWGFLSGITLIGGVIYFYAAVLFLGPFIVARLQNLWWPHTTLGPYPFNSQLSTKAYMLLQLKNWLLIILTLALYRPFAVVANTRMRAQAVSLTLDSSMDDVLQNFDGTKLRAAGAEAADLVGFDLSL